LAWQVRIAEGLSADFFIQRFSKTQGQSGEKPAGLVFLMDAETMLIEVSA